MRSWLVMAALAAVTCATAPGCKKSDKKTSPTTAEPAGGSGSGSGSAPGSAGAVAAATRTPPAAASKVGHECGAQLAKVAVAPLVAPAAGAAGPPPDQESGTAAAVAPGAAAAPAAPPPPAKLDPRKISKDGLPTSQVKAFAGVHQTGFRVSYASSDNTIHEQFHQILQSNKMFEQAAQALNETVRLPTTIDVQLVDCDQVNAFYDPDNHRVIVCYDLLEYFVQVFKPVAKSDDELGTAVLGATLFSFYHETGHALIHLLDLPAVGREEDSADQIATLILMAQGDQGVSMAMSGAYWFQLQAQSGSNDTPFWDEHGFDGQRFYNILCLIYGSDPDKYGDFVSTGNLPKDRAEQCPAEYKKIRHAWEKLLEPYLTNDAAQNIDVAPSVPPAETADKAPPTPAAGGHAITCQQVAEKATQLIAVEYDKQTAGLTAEQKQAAAQSLEANMPSFLEQFLAQCAKEDWPDKDRQCVLDAATLDDASHCGQ